MKQTFCISILLVMLFSGLAHAQGLRHILPQLMNQHERIKAAEANRDAALAILDQTRAAWYPSVDLMAEAGHEKIRKPDHSSNSETRHVATLRGSQLVTDFGTTSGSIDRAREQVERAKTELRQIRQEVLLEGITAFLQVVKAREQLNYARKSATNIIQQTGMEETLVQKGAGLSSDVLQIKAQLAGARAHLAKAKGELNRAKNRFKAVYKRMPTDQDITDLTLPIKTFAKLPLSLEEAVSKALDANPDILLARHQIQIAEHTLTVNKAAYLPQIHAVAEGKRRENDDGVRGVRYEGRAGVDFRYNLFRGGADVAAVQATRSDILRLKKMERHARDLTEEHVANAWQNLLTSRENHDYLNEQSVISEAFLNLARKERTLGTRSLLDVLTGEINFITATSEAVKARIETYEAAYALYYAMGCLDMDLF